MKEKAFKPEEKECGFCGKPMIHEVTYKDGEIIVDYYCDEEEHNV
jgi:hypothetical protein